MGFKYKIALMQDSAINILKKLLKINGSFYSKEQLCSFTKYEIETIRRQLLILKKAGIVEVNNDLYGVTDKFREEYNIWKYKEYVASKEDKIKFEKLNEKYWIIRPIVEALINSKEMFDLSFILYDDLQLAIGSAERTIIKYIKILEENGFLEVIKRGRFKTYILEESLIKIWEEIKLW